MLWLPVILCMGVAAALRLHMNNTLDYLLMGADGPYYPLQIRGILEHGGMLFPDMPLLFYLQAALAYLLRVLHVASPDQCILLAVRFTDAFLPPLAAIPVFLMARELQLIPRKTGYLMLFFATLGITPVLVFSGGLQKNAVAVTWIFLFFYFLLRLLRHSRRKDAYAAGLVLLLCAFTHFGSFTVILFFTVLLGLVWAVRNPTFLKRIPIKGVAGALLSVLLFLGIVVIFDPHRFFRLLAIPFKLFEAPVILFTLEGQSVVLVGFSLMNVILVNVLSVFAFVQLIRRRREMEPALQTLAWALLLFCFFLSSPLLGLEWANRLYMAAYIPLTVLYLILFTQMRSVGAQWFPVAAFSGTVLVSVIGGAFSSFTGSITHPAYEEFAAINRAVPLDEHVALVGRQDIRLLGNWAFHSKGIADYLLTADDLHRYKAIYIVRQTNGSYLPPGRFRETEVPAHSPRVYQGNYFELYRLTDTVGWHWATGSILRRAGGTLQSLDNDRLVLKDTATGILRTVAFSPETDIQFPGGHLPPLGSYVTALGKSKPFTLTLQAQIIRGKPVNP